jgi:DNA-binding NarL/FixJ family response regulator
MIRVIPSLREDCAMSVECVPEVIDVFLLAQNRLLREALAKVLNKKSDLHVVASAALPPQILEQINVAAPQVLLLASDLLGYGSAQIVEGVRKEMSELKVVMVGMDEDKEVFLRFVRAGVAGYLLKEASAAEISAAVHSVVRGEAVCSPRLCQSLFDYMARQSTRIPGIYGKLQFGLTNREQQLVQLISHGLTNKEIANQLSISDQTVKHHVHQVLRKLGADDRLSAVEICRLHGMCA